ncbi:MAG: DUF2911 domain-containing protein [Bacteroidia bacterium]|nr:DUF2911 domain-containing protein [Bacteroidia bacterium]
MWTVLFNADTTKLYGHPSEYDPGTEAARIEVTPEQTTHRFESLTIWLDHVRYDAELLLAWEHTLIHFTIQTHDHDEVKAAIAQALEKNPVSIDLLSQAAYYYTSLGENDEQVLAWLNKALAIHEDRWVYIQKIELLEKRKDYKQARSTAEKALAYLRKKKPDNDGWEHTMREIEAKIKKVAIGQLNECQENKGADSRLPLLPKQPSIGNRRSTPAS